MYMSNFYTLNERLKECHNDMDFLRKNGITVDRVKAERRRRDAAVRANAASGPLGAAAVLRDILPTQNEYNDAPPEATAGGRKTRKTRRKRRIKKRKSRRKMKTRRRRKKRKTRKKRR